MSMKKLTVGLIGCGVISDIYLSNCKNRFGNIDIVACADIVEANAVAKAQAYGIEHMSVDELIAHSDIDMVLNLTIPTAHYQLSKRCLEAGKHVYGEKPLALTVAESLELVTLAKSKGLKIGSAPDTFLGAAVQTAVKLINDGEIGLALGANAFFMSSGTEGWHPNPEFFYKPGAGPLFDMGPYYLNALIALLGPVAKVTGMAQTPFKQKTITGPSRTGEVFAVETPTSITSLLGFECGAVATLTTTFDMSSQYWEMELPYIEIYGSKGSLWIPDPNYFGGEGVPLPDYCGGKLKLRRGGEPYQEVAYISEFSDNLRGMGLCDLADAVLNERAARASGELGLHVVEIMAGVLTASETGQEQIMQHKCHRPEALPSGLPAHLF